MNFAGILLLAIVAATLIGVAFAIMVVTLILIVKNPPLLWIFLFVVIPLVLWRRFRNKEKE